MAIYTRWGMRVEITGVPEGAHPAIVNVLTEDGKEQREDWRTLKADGGISEIVDALKAIGIDDTQE